MVQNYTFTIREIHHRREDDYGAGLGYRKTEEFFSGPAISGETTPAPHVAERGVPRDPFGGVGSPLTAWGGIFFLKGTATYQSLNFCFCLRVCYLELLG